MSLKPKIEAIIYAADEPVTLTQLLTLLGPDLEQALAEQDAVQPELPIEDAAVDSTPGEATEPAVETSAEEPSEALAVDETPAPEAASEEGSSDASTDVASPSEADLFEAEKKAKQAHERRLKDLLRAEIAALMSDFEDRGTYITEVASGFRMSTKPEYHDLIRDFAKSLKPPLKLSLPALETLAVIAYKQPVTAAEVGEIRGVDSAGVLGGLMTRKLITTAGRKQVIGRPILYKTTKEFLLRFGLKDINELPSIEEFEKMAGELAEQEDIEMQPNYNTDVIPGETPEDKGEDVVPETAEETPEEPIESPEPEPQADGSGDSAESTPDVVPGSEPSGDGGDADESRPAPSVESV